MGMAKNDFLRQVIGYKLHPNHPWLKEVYYIKDEYRELLEEMLRGIERTAQHPLPPDVASLRR